VETLWYDNGQRAIETHFKDGEKDGVETVWFESGQKKSETPYRAGKKDGLQTNWDVKGYKFQYRYKEDEMVQ
jgi:antitoxin component YwqK of YwqJK toxin-antitoxin module